MMCNHQNALLNIRTLRPLFMLVLLAAMPSQALAQCQELPPAPEILENEQLKNTQLEQADAALAQYWGQIDSMKDCVSSLIASIYASLVDSADESNPDQAVPISPLAQSYEQVLLDLETVKNATIERYNYLVETSVEETTNDTTN